MKSGKEVKLLWLFEIPLCPPLKKGEMKEEFEKGGMAGDVGNKNQKMDLI